jgi:hypothetical protein
MAYISIAVICSAVTLLLASTLLGIVYGETSGESQINEEYSRRAKKYNAVNFHPV